MDFNLNRSRVATVPVPNPTFDLKQMEVIMANRMKELGRLGQLGRR